MILFYEANFMSFIYEIILNDFKGDNFKHLYFYLYFMVKYVTNKTMHKN